MTKIYYFFATLLLILELTNAAHLNLMGNINPHGLEVFNETQLNIRNCQNLCGRCGCVGFYCGAECICECNQATDMASEATPTAPTVPAAGCLKEMQIKARILNLPFELLIQGPNANRLVKSAIEMDQTANLENLERNKRSTVSIYRPETSEDVRRETRSTKHKENMDWFNEFASGLMRPTARKGKSVDVAEEQQKSVQTETSKTHEPKERTWFDAEEDDERTEHDNKPYYKSPYSKRSGKSSSSGYKQEEDWKNKKYQNNRLIDNKDEENLYTPEAMAKILYDMPMKVVDSLPIGLRDAIKRIRMNMANSAPVMERNNKSKNGKKYADMPQESEEVETTPTEDTYNRSEEIERLLRGLQQNAFGVLGMPASKSMGENKSTKSYGPMPFFSSPEYWMRLHEALQQQHGKENKKNRN